MLNKEFIMAVYGDVIVDKDKFEAWKSSERAIKAVKAEPKPSKPVVTPETYAWAVKGAVKAVAVEEKVEKSTASDTEKRKKQQLRKKQERSAMAMNKGPSLSPPPVHGKGKKKR